MDIRQQKRFLWLETALSWLVLGVLIYFTFLEFIQAPYIGFNFTSRSNGEIVSVYQPPSPGEVSPLHPKQNILMVNGVDLQVWSKQLRTPLLPELSAGDTLTLVVGDNREQKTIDWVVPGFNMTEFNARLQNAWPFGYLFWLAGLATVLLVRPFDTKRSLFIAFFFLTALWLVIGNTSRWGIGESRLLYRVALVLSAPVLIHLHWIFPRPLGKVPRWVWAGLYAIAIGIALLHWTPYMSTDVAVLALALALAISFILLLLHYWRQPETRAQVGLLLFALFFAFFPIMVVTLVISIFDTFNANITYGLVVLPLIPGAYFYSIYRFQLGGSEFRANRLIALYLYLVLLAIILLPIIAIISVYTNFDNSPAILGIVLSVATALVSIYGFPPFQRLVEHRLLAMPLPPVELLDTYIERITTTLNEERLIHLLKNEVLPTLLVRESALIRARDNDLATFYCSHPHLAPPPKLQSGILNSPSAENGDAHTPMAFGATLPSTVTMNDFAHLHEHFKNQAVYRFTEQDGAIVPSWVKLGLALQVGDNLLGFWLLGRRDPDDSYAMIEVNTLQTLARQTALALANIDQSAQLQALYQVNIERREQEHIKMAHFLHDAILNQAVVLYNAIPEPTPKIQKEYEQLKDYIRYMTTTLRPPSLLFGLGVALEELANELIDREKAKIYFDVIVEPKTLQYAPQTESHIYHIAQQACENALRHAQPTTIKITGKLTPTQVDLTIEDDGIGFAIEKPLNVAYLLAEKHFGLVHMLERAGHIQARLMLDSTPGKGTTVHLYWVNKETSIDPNSVGRHQDNRAVIPSMSDFLAH